MADNIFSGLESFGFGGLEGLDLFEKKEEPKRDRTEKTVEVPQITESSFLFDKTIACPCCDNKFKIRAVKNSSARLIGTDRDLRPKHENIDVTKYDCIVCPMCGYAAVSRYFPNLVKLQRDAIQTKISPTFKKKTESLEEYTYDYAIEMYKLALLNAVVKKAKASEKAYICLKTSWLYRGKAEEVGEDNPEYKKIRENEFEFTKNAYEGFSVAVSSESFPMCGMDEITVDYLLANLAYMTGHYDVSSKLISSILVSKVASSRIKDKARELKEELLKKLRT